MKQLNWYQIFGNTKKIPDGRTVEPTDDIQIWLNCANIWDKTYTTLAEVLADTDTLSALISNNNAVDYMVRSTTWAVQITVPVMTSNTTPSGVAFASSVLDNSSSYYAYKVFDNNSTTLWISDRGTTSPSNPQYIGYEFTSPTNVIKAVVENSNQNRNIPKDYVLQAFDGEEWIDVVSGQNSTTGANAKWSIVGYTANVYSKWRIYITSILNSAGSGNVELVGVQFYSASITADATAMTYIGLNNYASNTLLADETWCEAIGESEYVDSVLNTKIPKMTTNTTPSGVASASSAYSGRPAYRAFDRDMSTTWNGNVAGSPGQTLEAGWIQYQFTKAVSAKYLTIYTSNPCPLIAVMGSNDGVTFEDVASVENIPNNEQFGSALLNSEDYIYYRFKVTQKNTSGGTLMMPVITELQLYGREDV